MKKVISYIIMAAFIVLVFLDFSTKLRSDRGDDGSVYYRKSTIVESSKEVQEGEPIDYKEAIGNPDTWY